MSIFGLFFTSLAAGLSENLVFSNYLGLEPFLESTEKRDSAWKTGLSLTFAITVCCFVTSVLDILVLKTLDIGYMRTVMFVLVVATFAKVAPGLSKILPKKLSALFVPSSLVIGNCAVLGSALLVSEAGLNPFYALIYGASLGLGFTLSCILFAEIRERVKRADVPSFLRGLPIILITAGLVALAFMGF